MKEYLASLEAWAEHHNLQWATRPAYPPDNLQAIIGWNLERIATVCEHFMQRDLDEQEAARERTQ